MALDSPCLPIVQLLDLAPTCPTATPPAPGFVTLLAQKEQGDAPTLKQQEPVGTLTHLAVGRACGGWGAANEAGQASSALAE